VTIVKDLVLMDNSWVCHCSIPIFFSW
jgi:hypothetical protein